MQATNNNNNKLTIDIALLGMLAVLWGASYGFIKVGVETIPPFTLIAARTIIAAIVLLIVMHFYGIKMPRDPVLWRRFLIQALINSVIPFSLIAWSEQYVDSGLATILNSTSPIFTFLVTAIITRHEAITARKLLGVVLGIAGIVLVVGLEALRGLGTQVLAQLAIVAATLGYTGAAIFGRNFIGLHPMVPATGSLICGGIVLAPVSLLERPWEITPSTSSILALLGLAVFSTAMGFILYFYLLRKLGSVGTTAQAYLRVPVGVLIGVLFLGETLNATKLLGLALVVGGVAAMVIPKRAPQPRASEPAAQ